MWAAQPQSLCPLFKPPELGGWDSFTAAAQAARCLANSLDQEPISGRDAPTFLAPRWESPAAGSSVHPTVSPWPPRSAGSPPAHANVGTPSTWGAQSTPRGGGGAKTEAQIAEGKSCPTTIPPSPFHVSSSNGSGATKHLGSKPKLPPGLIRSPSLSRADTANPRPSSHKTQRSQAPSLLEPPLET